jgi:hypothetical protein
MKTLDSCTLRSTVGRLLLGLGAEDLIPSAQSVHYEIVSPGFTPDSEVTYQRTSSSPPQSLSILLGPDLQTLGANNSPAPNVADTGCNIGLQIPRCFEANLRSCGTH